ncbi:hypothetical protein PCE1_001499 [Barthelona sp. PCE]
MTEEIQCIADLQFPDQFLESSCMGSVEMTKFELEVINYVASTEEDTVVSVSQVQNNHDIIILSGLYRLFKKRNLVSVFITPHVQQAEELFKRWEQSLYSLNMTAVLAHNQFLTSYIEGSSVVFGTASDVMKLIEMEILYENSVDLVYFTEMHNELKNADEIRRIDDTPAFEIILGVCRTKKENRKILFNIDDEDQDSFLSTRFMNLLASQLNIDKELRVINQDPCFLNMSEPVEWTKEETFESIQRHSSLPRWLLRYGINMGGWENLLTVLVLAFIGVSIWKFVDQENDLQVYILLAISVYFTFPFAFTAKFGVLEKYETFYGSVFFLFTITSTFLFFSHLPVLDRWLPIGYIVSLVMMFIIFWERLIEVKRTFRKSQFLYGTYIFGACSSFIEAMVPLVYMYLDGNDNTFIEYPLNLYCIWKICLGLLGCSFLKSSSEGNGGDTIVWSVVSCCVSLFNMYSNEEYFKEHTAIYITSLLCFIWLGMTILMAIGYYCGRVEIDESNRFDTRIHKPAGALSLDSTEAVTLKLRPDLKEGIDHTIKDDSPV